jgi:hypothetical protein
MSASHRSAWHVQSLSIAAARPRDKVATHPALPGLEPGFPSQGGGIGEVLASFSRGRGLQDFFRIKTSNGDHAPLTWLTTPELFYASGQN